MSNSATLYDLIIIGGGITGAGIARDAVLRGLRVALFEKGDYGSGTSSKSSKLIHGGLRYLEHGEIGLVFESVSERAVQQSVAPHLVRPLPFLLPVYKHSKPGLELMNIGLWVYDTLALFRAPKLHRTFRGDKARELEPLIRHEDLRGVIEYYDCVTDDARLVLENILDARANGADCRSYTEVVEIERDDSGRACGVRVRDRMTGSEERVAGRAIIMAAGAWTDEANDKLGIRTGRRLLRRTKGVHIVFPADKLPLRHAVTLLSPLDGRFMFVIPWRSCTVIGTTDTDFTGSADDVHADAADARYLCDSANYYFPQADFQPAEAISSWAGLRPLINDESTEDESAVSREHEIFVRDDGIIIIAGGKLTTYRRMAKQVVRKALSWLKKHDRSALEDRELSRPRTKSRPLPGAQGLEEEGQRALGLLARSLAGEHGMDPAVAEHLTLVYGSRAREVANLVHERSELGEPMVTGLPYIWAEAVFAIRKDLARTVEDVLARRVPLLLVSPDQGRGAAERVADMLAEITNLDKAQRAEQLAHYEQVVASAVRFREPAPTSAA